MVFDPLHPRRHSSGAQNRRSPKCQLRCSFASGLLTRSAPSGSAWKNGRRNSGNSLTMRPSGSQIQTLLESALRTCNHDGLKPLRKTRRSCVWFVKRSTGLLGSKSPNPREEGAANSFHPLIVLERHLWEMQLKSSRN